MDYDSLRWDLALLPGAPRSLCGGTLRSARTVAASTEALPPEARLLFQCGDSRPCWVSARRCLMVLGNCCFEKGARLLYVLVHLSCTSRKTA
jgi:hypothetical protein